MTIGGDEFESQQQLLDEMKAYSRSPQINYKLDVIESVCGHVLRKAGLPDHAVGHLGRPAINGSLEDVANDLQRQDPDSNTAYCARLIVLIKELRLSTEKLAVANCAYEIGRLWTEWQIILKCDKAAQAGEKQLASLKNNSDGHNDAKLIEAAAKWKPVCELAAQIWEHNPELSASRVAGLVKSQLNLTDNPRTITGRMKKVGLSSPAHPK